MSTQESCDELEMANNVEGSTLRDGTTSLLGNIQKTQALLEESNALKEEATLHFRQGDWIEAIERYQSALNRLIPREGEGRKDQLPDQEVEVPLRPGGEQLAKARAVLNGNIGACHLRLKNFVEAVKSCSEALADDPDYIKVLWRRTECNEKIGSWSALTQAQTDLKHLLDLLSPNDHGRAEANRRLKELEPRIAAAQKVETDEMLKKLKELGNNFLGNFGLSTDNFKLQPNGQGGYSMQFSQ